MPQASIEKAPLALDKYLEFFRRARSVRTMQLIRLHDFAHKDVKLSVLLFTHFGNLVGP
jgi:hypothetical protein